MLPLHYPSQVTNGWNDPPFARRDPNSRQSLPSLPIPSAQKDIPRPFSDSCLQSGQFSPFYSQNRNWSNYTNAWNAAPPPLLDNTTGPDLTPLLTPERIPLLTPDRTPLLTPDRTPLLTADGTSELGNVPLPGPNSKLRLGPHTTPHLGQNDPQIQPQNESFERQPHSWPYFSTFRSRSQLAQQLMPLSCIFKEDWVQICENAPATEKLATIRQCLDPKKVTQKKPQEMNSIMKSAMLTDEECRWVLDVRRKMMRQKNRQTKRKTPAKD